MKPRWIIQKNDIADQDLQELQDILKSLDIDYCLITYIPFSTDIPDFPIDDEHENIYYGGTSMIENIRKKYNPKGIFFNPDTFSMEVYLEKWKGHMLNDGAKIFTIKEYLADYGKNYSQDMRNYFFRPNGDGKEFDGQIGNPDKIVKVLKGILQNNEKVNEDFKIVVGSAYRIGKEWRLYMVNGRALTASQYRNEQRLSKSDKVPLEVFEFAQERCKEFMPHQVFAMDICEYFEDGVPHYAILECGCMNSVGFYHCDKQKYIEGISNWVISN